MNVDTEDLMLVFIKGIGCLLLTLVVFSVFSMKFPKGDKAMGGLASAAVTTFLVEAIYKYIGGDFLGFQFLGEVGSVAGTMGGVAAGILVPIGMGLNPVYAVAIGVAVGGFGILPGFLAGYVCYFIIKVIDSKLPPGVDVIVATLLSAVIAREIAVLTDPAISVLISNIGDAIMIATDQSPILMGFVLGGLIKIVCTSPLSSMALTAMLQLTGLPMGIAAIACFGGSFTNGLIFKGLKLGDNGAVAAVMMEPLTQADIVSKNALPLYSSNFIGGGLAGIAAASLHIVNNAPGTASPIPGMLAPFAFNDPSKVFLALGLAAVGGIIAGIIGSLFYTKTRAGIKLFETTTDKGREEVRKRHVEANDILFAIDEQIAEEELKELKAQKKINSSKCSRKKIASNGYLFFI